MSEEVEQEQEEQAPEEQAEDSKPRKASDELKVVILLKGNRAMVGVQSPDCDPIFTTLEGNMAAALERVPSLVAEANQKWDSNPRYPKANLPEEPVASTPPRSSSTTPKPKPAQPSWF